ncbi:MAG: hypothetical protein KDK08_28110 [Rhizobiaceae bacterium]|nr:hypothetical protein [Rhizobiaceae bacterium]
MEKTAFPARELHTINPGDLIDIDRGTVIFGAKSGSKTNDCLPDLHIKGPYDSLDSKTGQSIAAQVLLGGSFAVGPGGLIQLDAKGKVAMGSTATFEVPILSQKDPDGGERTLTKVDPASFCSDYREMFAGNYQGRVMVSRSYYGREELIATLTLAGGLQVSADKSEILNLLATVMGARTLPVDALSLSADGTTGRLTAIRKPPAGELALGFVPMFLNKERVAQIHYYLAGERGAALRDLVDEALNSPDPSLLEKALDGVRLLFGRELSDEEWARQFLQPQEGQGSEVMQLTSVVIEELEGEIPGVKSNLAYYAAAVELSGGASGISSFDDKRQ